MVSVKLKGCEGRSDLQTLYKIICVINYIKYTIFIIFIEDLRIYSKKKLIFLLFGLKETEILTNQIEDLSFPNPALIDQKPCKTPCPL